MSEEKIDLEVLITLKGRTAASRIKLRVTFFKKIEDRILKTERI